MPDQSNDSQAQITSVQNALQSHRHLGPDAPQIGLKSLAGFFGMNTAIPTTTPSAVGDSIQFNSTTGQIWYRDTTSQKWRGTAILNQPFGGTGADGALSVQSGTTTINLGGAALVIKNYTSIDIANGATLAFSNPASTGTIVVLKCTGDVIIGGTLNLKGVGGQGGTGGTNNPTLNGGPGIAGSTGVLIVDGNSHNGGASLGGFAVSSGAVSGGTAGPILTIAGFYTQTPSQVILNHGVFLACGSGGSGGAAGGNGLNTGGTHAANGGNGGSGGGALYMECGGAFDFTGTGTIDVSGSDGIAAGSPNGGSYPADATGGGGGGGGSCGMAVILYNTLTNNSGTVLATGGNAGAGSNSAPGDGQPSHSSAGGGGAGAGSKFGAGGGGGNGGAADADGVNGGNAGGNGAGAGGGGGGGGDSVNAAHRTGGSAGTQGASDSTSVVILQNTVFN